MVRSFGAYNLGNQSVTDVIACTRFSNIKPAAGWGQDTIPERKVIDWIEVASAAFEIISRMWRGMKGS